MGTDSLYYIRDYSGNYYRINNVNELVAVRNETDATVFNYDQAKSHIGTGKKSAFYRAIPIETEDGNDGGDIAFNSVEVREEPDMENQYENISAVKELTYEEILEQPEKSVSAYNLSEMDWTEYLTHFTYVVEGLKDYRDELNKKQSDVDQKICDILHYIELCQMDDEQAIDLVELLRVCRENRRDIKDEIQRVECFQANLGTHTNVIKAKQALNSIKGLETRKYNPRKYKELFKNCVMKDKRLEKEDLYESQNDYEDNYETKKQNFCLNGTYENEGGEEMIIEERKNTSLDGKKNDWYSFAKQQADFYRNAAQYIANLQMDVNDIDDEIEKILEETEDAKCNVAQGYNVFKKLKELRLERKAKTQELKCLYVLTDYIDCEALADTCEDNLDEIEEILDVPNLKNVVIEVEKNDISEQSKDVVSQVMAGRSDEKQMENVEGMVS